MKPDHYEHIDDVLDARFAEMRNDDLRQEVFSLTRYITAYAVVAGLLALFLLFVHAYDLDGATRYAVPDIDARVEALSRK